MFWSVVPLPDNNTAMRIAMGRFPVPR
jgi:hypothetical protein